MNRVINRTREWIAITGFAVLAIVLTLVATRHGPGSSPDSVSYLASARTFAHHGIFLDFDGSTLAYWPPGFPALLAIFELVGIRGADAARFVNSAMLGSTVILTYLLLRRHVRSSWIMLFGVATVAVSPALLRTTDMVWSEPTFTMLVLASVLVLEDACRTLRPHLLVAAGVVASCAAQVRYFGLAIVPAGIVAIVLASLGEETDRRRAIGRGVLAAAWFTLWAVLGPALWAFRNLSENQPALGPRTGAGASVVTVAETELAAVGHLFVPDKAPDRPSELLGVAILAVVIAGVVMIVRDRRERAMTPLVATVIAFLVAAFASRITAGSDIDSRILSPVYPLLVVVALWLFDTVRGAEHRDTARGFVKALAVFGIAGLVAFGVGAAALAWSHGRQARGFGGTGRARSELVAATRALSPGVSVYSDDPLTISYVTERLPVRLLLAPGQPNVIGRAHPSATELEHTACSRPVYVAWFAGEDTLPVTLTNVRRYRDGILGRVDAPCN